MGASASRGHAPEEDASSRPTGVAARFRSKPALALVAAGVVLLAVVAGGSRLRDGERSAAPVLASWGRWITQPGPTSSPDGDPDWRLDFTCGVSCSLVTDDERVYVMNRSIPDGGSSQTEITAYDGASGEEAWDHPVEIVGYSLPYVLEDGDLIVSGLEELRRVDPTTGEARWRADGHYVSSTDEIVVVAEYGEPNRSVVDAATGAPLWGAQGSVTTCGDAALLLTQDRIARVGPRTGEEVWGVSLDEEDTWAVEVGHCNARFLAYASDADEVTVLDLANGEEADVIDVATSVLQPGMIDVIGDLVIVRGGGRIMAYENRNGTFAEAWSADGPTGDSDIYVGGDTLAAIGDDGQIQILDLADGSARGKASMPVDTRVTVTTESILVPDDGAIRALRLSDAAVRWELGVDDPIEVEVGDDHLFVISGTEVQAYS